MPRKRLKKKARLARELYPHITLEKITNDKWEAWQHTMTDRYGGATVTERCPLAACEACERLAVRMMLAGE